MEKIYKNKKLHLISIDKFYQNQLLCINCNLNSVKVIYTIEEFNFYQFCSQNCEEGYNKNIFYKKDSFKIYKYTINSIKNRLKELEIYYKNPQLCQKCSIIIKIPFGAKIFNIKLKKFCNKCRYELEVPNPEYQDTPTKLCDDCGVEINLKKSNNKFRVKKFCKDCLRKSKIISLSKMRQKTEVDSKVIVFFENQQISKLYQNGKNWQSVNSTIRKHARKIFLLSDRPKCCQVCGYTNHIEVCHIKRVSSFSKETTINEINELNNLVGLCPNHHWELDNGLLKLPL